SIQQRNFNLSRSISVVPDTHTLSLYLFFFFAGKNLGEPLVMYGDIAVPTGLGNADPCTEQGCLQFCKERSIIIKGLRSFAQSTCIRFTPLNRQRDFVNIQSLSGCFSYVGRQGRNQTHELLHALGFNHEQTRSDRMEHNFRKIQTRNLGTPYDYNSVMHYGRFAFSKNRQPTILPIPDNNVVLLTSSGSTASTNKIKLEALQ
uniref:Peptidase M12A domain-containing protein n=1 Tax=Lates calcarifer TaxID=8187 RepID=A0A4W6ENU4_LATCA